MKGHRLKVKGYDKIFHANGNQAKDGAAILVSEKTDFKTKTLIRDKEGKTLHNDKEVTPTRT